MLLDQRAVTRQHAGQESNLQASESEARVLETRGLAIARPTYCFSFAGQALPDFSFAGQALPDAFAGQALPDERASGKA